MNSPTVLRALAALCLLCVLPRLGALTITQTTSFTASGSAAGYGPLTGPGGVWHYLPFNTTLGTLQSVAFSVTTVATVNMLEINAWATPQGPVGAMLFTPRVEMNLFATSTDGGGGNSFAGSSGPTVTLQYLETASHTADLTTNVAALLTDSSSLARYSGVGQWPLGITPHQTNISTTIHSSGRFGGVSSEGTATVTLTYHYDVPDAGNSGLLGTAMLICLLGFHRITESRAFRS